MAVYEKGIETRRNLVLATYRMLQEMDASKITVRSLAKEVGCSPAALYRHFENIEYLIVVASIRFFEKYMIEYGVLMDTEPNLLKQYVDGWKLFNRYAFERPDLYYRLIWGQYNESLADALTDYMELFPFTASTTSPDYFYTMIFDNDIMERDFLILRRAVNQGLLSEENANYFSKSNPLLVKGMIEMCMHKDLAERKRCEQDCNALLLKNMERIYRETVSFPESKN